MNQSTRLGSQYRYVVLLMLLPIIGGCGGFPNFGNLFSFNRTNDGGGGNVIGAGLKILNGQLTALNQDEVQALSDQARGLIQTIAPQLPIGPEMTNQQADAFIEFLGANNLNSLQDVANLTQNPLNVVIPASLVTAYLGTNIMVDSGNVDLTALFGNVFTGV